jgi:hypothetical protein
MRAHAASLTLMSLVVALNGAQAQSVVRSYPETRVRSAAGAPDVSVWIDRFSYRPGQRIRAFFESEPGAFVTILRVTTTGDIAVLYPHRPSLQQPYRSGRLIDDEVPYASDLPFFINEPEGIGFVVAIASFEPFDYGDVSSRDRWNTYQLTSAGYSDPFTVVTRFIDRTLRETIQYSTDVIQYQVERTLYYPRPYGYADYDYLYDNCLTYYFGHPLYYCAQLARFGYSPYFAPFIGRVRPFVPAPSTPSGKYTRPPVPRRMIPDPSSTERGIEKDPSNGGKKEIRSASRAEAQRAWWNVEQREAAKRNPGAVVDRGMRVDPQTDMPRIYRNGSAEPRVDARPGSKYEPMTQSGFQPAPAPRSEETRPRRVEPRERPLYEPIPQQRYEPAGGSKYERPQQRSEPPAQAAPVLRMDPPREFHPAPVQAPVQAPQVIRTEPVHREAPPPPPKKDQL